MADLFNVVFSGQIAGTADPAAVRANVGKLFNASEAVLDKLFSGQPVAIKKMVDQATAMQLRARMKQAGADVRIVPVDAEGRPLAAAAGAAAPRPATTPVAAATTAAPRPATTPAATAPAASARPAAAPSPTPPAAAPKPATTGGDWALKPVGSILSDPAPPPPPPPDISGITVAPGGGNLVKPGEIARPAPVQVDISGLAMAAPGTDVLKEEERRRVEPVQVDLSGISMAEVGAPLDELRDDKPPVNPDISHLSLV